MQIRNGIVLGIAQGELQPGEKLPTIRGLATEAGINMMTVSKAYKMLSEEGYIETNRANGAWVSMGEGSKQREKVKTQMELVASEAKLSGMELEDFINLCREAFMKGEGRGK